MARPRSIQAHHEVLDAAANLFAERGIDATSMDAIAAASGVSKATIYKHWADKDQLALEVMLYIHGLDEEQPVFDSGDARADLIAQLSYQPAEDKHEMKARLMPHLMAYSMRNQEFGHAWRERVIERQRSALKAILERGIKQRQLAKNLDIDFSIGLLVGPMLYWRIFLNRNKAGKLPPSYVEQAIDAFWKAFARNSNHVAPPPPIKSRN